MVLWRSFVYTRAARCSVYTRSNCCSVYTRSNHRSVYTRSNRRFVYTRGWCILTHTGVRGAASAWAADILLSSDCDGVCVTAVVRSVVWEMTLAVGRLVLPISNTVGGWAWRSKAAASGWAASITTRVSGRWARGSSGYTTPGLSLVASPASRVGQVIRLPRRQSREGFGAGLRQRR